MWSRWLASSASASKPCLDSHAIMRRLGSLPLTSNGTHICTVSLGITCTPDLFESMCPPRCVSCPSTHHIHRQSMSIPKNVSVSKYEGNVNNTIRTFLEQKPTLCVCLSGQYRSICILYIHTFVQSRYICTCLGITCTPDLLESMCPPRGVSCHSTHHIHRQTLQFLFAFLGKKHPPQHPHTPSPSFPPSPLHCSTS